MSISTSEMGPSWIYQGRRVNTQGAAGPAALVTRISVASGQLAKLKKLAVIGPLSAGSTLMIELLDEDGSEIGLLANVAAGAGRHSHLPSIGVAAAAHNNVMDSTDLTLASGQYIRITASVSLITESLDVFVELELFNVETTPTWDTTGSGGTPTLAASTISATNTLTFARMNR